MFNKEINDEVIIENKSIMIWNEQDVSKMDLRIIVNKALNQIRIDEDDTIQLTEALDAIKENAINILYLAIKSKE